MARTRTGSRPNFNKQIIESLTSAATLEAKDSGRLFMLNSATGFTTTLPAAEIGMKFSFVVDIGSTDGNLKITVGDAADYFYGRVVVFDNADDKLASQIVVKATAAAAPTSYDVITLDGDSNNSGGDVGSTIEIQCVSSNAWLVQAFLGTSGTPTSISTIA
jgi:hypothetical protein